ncbi:YceH family protein [Desulfocastanea catecholica]
MDILLTDDEVRVLGCLLEKEMATPDYYPLTLNALINACNQKSNRDPVVSFDEETVVYALNGLRERNLIRQSNISRAAKYEQIFAENLKLVTRERAIICILLLRGPQTVGEIRTRTERLYAFSSLDEVQTSIANLEDMQLVTRLPRQPGRKESRYAHLLSGEPEEKGAETILRVKKAGPEVDRTGELQQQIDELRREMQSLREEMAIFRSQFE